MKNFDMIAIGTGSAAAAAAYRCRAAGWEVAVLDRRPYGGTCALRGCDPKKVLVGATEVVDWARRMRGKGVDAAGARIDWGELMRFKRTFTDPVPASREKGFVDAGIATFHGRARFVDRTSISVDGETLRGRFVVIAAGAEPAKLSIPGEELLTISEQFLELVELPKNIVFVGGGYISFEFAHIAARAGAQVTILQRKPRPLVGFDPDLVNRLVAATRALGVDVRLNVSCIAVERHGNRLQVEASGGDPAQTLEADMVVHGAGRAPDLDDLDLEAAGVQHVRRGVVVNEYLQSVSNPQVYAAGDAVASNVLPLTPVATMHGEMVGDNLLKGNHRAPDYSVVSSVVYTVPHLAMVGLLEEQARERGLRFKTNVNADTSSWYSSRRVGAEYTGYKVLVEEDTGRILGAHLLGPKADEVINVFAAAMRGGLAAKDLAEFPFAYPTEGYDLVYMV